MTSISGFTQLLLHIPLLSSRPRVGKALSILPEVNATFYTQPVWEGQASFCFLGASEAALPC